MAPTSPIHAAAAHPVLLGRDLPVSEKHRAGKVKQQGPPRCAFASDANEPESELLQAVSPDVAVEDIFNDFLMHFSSIFTGKDYASQPGYIVHVGACNGRLLRLIYDSVKQSTPRGKVLQKHPLTAVAVESRLSQVAALEESLAQQGFPHVVLRGDASNLGEVTASLRGMGIDISRTVFVSSVGQALEYFAPQSAIDAGSPSAMFANAKLTEFVQLDRSGRRATACEVMASALEHFQSWVRMIHGSFGVCMLDAPTLASNSPCVPEDNEGAHGRRRTLPAATMAMAGAMAGLMPLRPKKVYAYPARALNCAALSQHLVERPFKIRLAQATDIDSLVRLEHLAWDANLVAPREVLLRRLSVSPTTCFVCEMEGRGVVACLYTQRINSTDDIFNETFMDVSSSHVPGGRVIQLIAISSDPEVSKLGIGSDLRCFALHLARLDPCVDTVCAVTRARNYPRFDGTMEEYCAAHTSGKLLDPILDFHTGYGAKIVSCVHKYRPEDTDNKAIGVLIQYQIRNLPGSVQHEGQSNPIVPVVVAEGLAPSPARKVRVSALQQLRTIMDSIGYTVDEDNLSKGFFEYDMDSLELVQVRNKLGTSLGKELPATLLLDFPNVQSLAEELDKDFEEDDDDDDSVDVATLAPSMPSTASPPAISSRELLSGLFADIGQSIDGDAFDQGFFELDLDSLDLVRVKNQLGQKLSLELPPTLLLDYPTSRALVQYLDKVRGVADDADEEGDDEADRQPQQHQHQEPQQPQQAEAPKAPVSKAASPPAEMKFMTWEGMTAKQYAALQKELMQELGKPTFQERFCELAKMYYPDFRVEYVMAIEPLLIQASGRIFVKWGLAKSCDHDAVQEARVQSWSCLRSLCATSPQLLKNTDMLCKITRLDDTWGF